MCVIVHKQAGIEIPQCDIEDMYETNSDGMGVMWAQDGKIHIERDLPRDYKAAVKFYDKHCLIERDCVIHFRMATHGSVSLDNTHPFYVNDKVALVHNGILHCVEDDKKNDRSDTRVFAEDVLKPMLRGGNGLLLVPSFKEMAEHFIGRNNIVVTMDYRGNMAFINGAEGDRIDIEEGTFAGQTYWVSNTFWQYQAWKQPINTHWSNTDWPANSWANDGKEGTKVYGDSRKDWLTPVHKHNRISYEDQADPSAWGIYSLSGFFALLNLCGHQVAHTKLSIPQVTAAMRYTTPKQWKTFMDRIETGAYGNADILKHVRRPKEYFEPANTQQRINMGLEADNDSDKVVIGVD